MAAEENKNDLKEKNELLTLQLRQVQEELEFYYLNYKDLESNGGHSNSTGTTVTFPSYHSSSTPPRLLRLIKRGSTASSAITTDEILENSPRYRALLEELESIRKKMDAEKKNYETRMTRLSREGFKNAAKVNAQVAEFKSNLEKLKARNRELEDKLNTGESERKRVKAEYEQASNSATVKDKEIRVLKNDVSEKLALIEELNAELKKLITENSEIEGERDVLQSELKQLKTECKQASNSATSKDKEIRVLKKEVSKKLALVEELNAELKKLITENSELEGGRDVLQSELKQLKAECEHASNSASSKDKKIGALKIEVSQKLTLVEELNTDLKKLINQNREIEGERDALHSELKHLKAVNDQASSTVSRKNKEIESIRKDLSVALRLQSLRESDLKDLQSRYGELLEKKKQQEELLLKVDERLRIAANYLQQIDNNGNAAWDHETVRKLVNSLTD